MICTQEIIRRLVCFHMNRPCGRDETAAATRLFRFSEAIKSAFVTKFCDEIFFFKKNLELGTILSAIERLKNRIVLTHEVYVQSLTSCLGL